MMTIGGALVRPTTDAVPSLQDMGYGLSQIVRYAGATTTPWTVLQHSYACYHYAARQHWPWIARLHCLLHDAHEAVTGDVTNSWKTPDLRALQDNLDERIWASIGIAPPGGLVAAMVKLADLAVLSAEARLFTPAKTQAALREWLGTGEYVDPNAEPAVLFGQRLAGGITPTEAGRLFEGSVRRLILEL